MLNERGLHEIAEGAMLEELHVRRCLKTAARVKDTDIPRRCFEVYSLATKGFGIS
jgi:hypothetical protein